MRKTTDILDENTKRTQGVDAMQSNIEAARAVSDIVKTTLGPMGMDKMLIDSYGDSTITNDGVKILKEMEIEHPGAKLLVEVAKTQEEEVGDGTTTAVILSGELLLRAQELMSKKIHPTSIIRSYKVASEKALEILEKESISVDPKNKKLIFDICSTAMTGKVAEFSKEKLSSLLFDCVNLVKNENGVDKNSIKIVKTVGGETKDSFLVEGIVLDKEAAHPNMVSKIENAKVLLVDFPLEIRELDSEAKINLSSLQDYEEFVKGEDEYLANIVKKIKDSGASVVVCQKGIDDNVSYFLAKEGILATRRTRRSDLEKLSLALNSKIVSSLNDIDSKNLSLVRNVEVKNLLGEKYVFIEGCKNPKAVTLVLKASTKHFIDEIERAVEDALGDISSIIRSQKIVAGGSGIELELYRNLISFSKDFSGKEQLIIEAYAKAFLSIPKILCENSGLEEIETIANLISRHEKGESKSGINSFKGVVKDTIREGIVEPISVKSQAIKSATESSSMILRIDDIIAAKKLKVEENEF